MLGREPAERVRRTTEVEVREPDRRRESSVGRTAADAGALNECAWWPTHVRRGARRWCCHASGGRGWVRALDPAGDAEAVPWRIALPVVLDGRVAAHFCACASLSMACCRC
eukprot:6178391-Pleurochrysis_carterae.AAC.7